MFDKITQTAHSRQDGILGEIVAVSLDEQFIPADQVRSRHREVGGEESLMFRPRARSRLDAFRLAASRLKTSRRLVFHVRDAERRKVIVDLAEGDNDIAYRRVLEAYLSDMDVVEIASQDSTIEELRWLTERFLTHYTDDDFRSWWHRAMKQCGAVRFSPGSGIYFVPAPCGIVDCWEQFLGTWWSGQGRLFMLRDAIADKPQTRATRFEVCITQFKEELRDMEKKLEESQNVRLSTLTKRLNEADALLSKIQFYETLLSLSAEELRTEAAAFRAKVEAMVQEKSAPPF